MKNYVIAVMLVLLTGGGVYLFFQQQRSALNIVYIDSKILMDRYKGMENARKDFQQKSTVWQANVDTLISQFRRELTTYEKERSSMTAKEKELQEQLLGNKQMQIEQYQEATRKKAQEEEQKIMQTVVNEINGYIKEYGRKKGYEFILGANSSGNVIYASEGKDITEEVLTGLNDEYSVTQKRGDS